MCNIWHGGVGFSGVLGQPMSIPIDAHTHDKSMVMTVTLLYTGNVR